MQKISEQRKGELISFIGAMLWSFFPILTVSSYFGLPPMVSLFWSTLISCIFFFIIALFRSSWINIFNKKIFYNLLLISLITAVGYYIFYFWGLKYTSPGNASIIAQFEIFFSFLFFNIWHKEFITKEHIMGIILMFLGALIVLSPNFSFLRIGDFLILMAAMLGPIGNFFQQKLRKEMNGEQILFFRTLLALPMIFLATFLFKEPLTLPNNLQTFLIVLTSGVVIFGITKVLWIETIHRIPVIKAISLSSISPFLTIIFAFLLLGNLPTIWQITAIIPITIGIYLLTRQNKNDESSLRIN